MVSNMASTSPLRRIASRSAGGRPGDASGRGIQQAGERAEAGAAPVGEVMTGADVDLRVDMDERRRAFGRSASTAQPGEIEQPGEEGGREPGLDVVLQPRRVRPSLAGAERKEAEQQHDGAQHGHQGNPRKGSARRPPSRSALARSMKNAPVKRMTMKTVGAGPKRRVIASMLATAVGVALMPMP